MQERDGAAAPSPGLVAQLMAASVHLFSVLYAKISFPPYANGLKEIAQDLGFPWSESDASG